MHHRRVPLLASVSVVILAACGHGPATPSPTPTPTAKPSASSTAGGTQTAVVLHAFEASLTAFDVAVREMNPDDPQIPATATDDQVIHELTTLNSWKVQGITAKGDLPHVIDSHVVSMTAATAQVKGCVYDPGVLIYKATGKDVPTNTAGQFYIDVDASLVLAEGAWKISKSQTQSEVTACLSGY